MRNMLSGRKRLANDIINISAAASIPAAATITMPAVPTGGYKKGDVATWDSNSNNIVITRNGTTLGTITLTVSSGARLNERYLNNETMYYDSPFTLNSNAYFEASIEYTMRINLRVIDSSGASTKDGIWGYGQQSLSYIIVPRSDTLRIQFMQPDYPAEFQGQIKTNRGGVMLLDETFQIFNPDSIMRGTPASVQMSPYEFSPSTSSSYYIDFPASWGLQSGYQYLDGAYFDIYTQLPSCELVGSGSVGYSSPSDVSYDIEKGLIMSYPDLRNILFTNPNGGNYYYVLYDGSHWRCCLAVISAEFPGQNPGEYRQGMFIVAYYTDGKTEYLYPYDVNGATQGAMDSWNSTGYTLNQTLINYIFGMGDSSALQQLMYDWQVSDECELITTIYNLATNK